MSIIKNLEPQTDVVKTCVVLALNVQCMDCQRVDTQMQAAVMSQLAAPHTLAESALSS